MIIKLKIFALGVLMVLLILISLYAFVAVNEKISQGPGEGSCEKIDAKTVRLLGKIDKTMRDCAMKTITQDVEVIRVRSAGGEVFAGRAIGFRIGERPRTLVVEGACVSSCGNYFVPAAARLKLMPGGFIALHGTPDPFLHSLSDIQETMATSVQEGESTQEEAELSIKQQTEKIELGLAEENTFASKFNVQLGWRMYRDVGDGKNGWLQHFHTTDESRYEKFVFLLVEYDMISTCLPNLTLEEPFQQSLDSHLYPKIWMRYLLWAGYYAPSNDLRCKKRVLPK